MTRPFMRITCTHGWIGRIAWWNTMDTQDMERPGSWPDDWPNYRIWGHAPIWLPHGWGPRLSRHQQHPPTG
jgi:hypothetical protein